MLINIHETLFALTLHVRPIFERFITGLFRALLRLPDICYLIEILLVVREWELEGMGIKTRLNLESGMGMGMNHWE